ncbi:MAG: hypothetical protein SNJ63_04140, partial [Sphingomonadaceae bacterium]
ALAFLASAPVFAALSQEPQGEPAPASRTARAVDPNEIRCRRETQVSSRIPGKRVCMTNAEWDRLARESSRFAQELVDQNRTVPIAP